MNIQLIKAFIRPKKHEAYLRRYLLEKVAKERPDFKFLKGNYLDAYTFCDGIMVFWFHTPLKNSKLTTGCVIFKTLGWFSAKIKRYFNKRSEK